MDEGRDEVEAQTATGDEIESREATELTPEERKRLAREEMMINSGTADAHQRLQESEIKVLKAFQDIFIKGAQDIDVVKQRLQEQEHQGKFAAAIQEAYVAYIGSSGVERKDINFSPVVKSICEEFCKTITEIDNSPKVSFGKRILDGLRSSLAKLFSVIKSNEPELGIEIRRPNDALKSAAPKILEKGRKIKAKGSEFNVEQLDEMLGATIKLMQAKGQGVSMSP